MRKIICFEDNFYLITSKDYDRDIDIIHSENEDWNAYFDRCIEPGLLNVFDANVIVDDDDDNGHLNVMQTLMKIGDYLYLDTLDVDMCGGKNRVQTEDDKTPMASNDMKTVDRLKTEINLESDSEPEGFHIDTCVMKYYCAFGFNWPYFSYGK